MPISAKDILWRIPARAVVEFVEDSAFRFCAALSFYTILSLAPLMVLLLSGMAVFYETAQVRSTLLIHVRDLFGPQGANIVKVVLDNAERSHQSGPAAVFGLIVLFFAATAVFAQLQDALNAIWGVKIKERRLLLSFVLTRVVSFGLVLGVGLLLLASLIFTATIGAMSGYLNMELPGGNALWGLADFAGSVMLLTLLFAMTFKWLPDVVISWSDVWIGAAVTALLFTVGKLGIGRLLGQSSLGSVFGAAGSLVIMLFWVYYSSLIFFLGAEITQVYTRRFGSGIRPRRLATRGEKFRGSQGI